MKAKTSAEEFKYEVKRKDGSWQEQSDCSSSECKVKDSITNTTDISQIEARVYVRNYVGWSIPSDVCPKPIIAAMEKPLVTEENGSMLVSWKQCTDEDCYYELFYGVIGYQRTNKKIKNAKKLQYRLPNLIKGEKYRICLRMKLKSCWPKVSPRFSCTDFTSNTGRPLIKGSSRSWKGAEIGRYLNMYNVKTVNVSRNCEWTKLKVCFRNSTVPSSQVLSKFEMHFSQCDSIMAVEEQFAKNESSCRMEILQGSPTHIQEFSDRSHAIIWNYCGNGGEKTQNKFETVQILGISLTMDNGNLINFGQTDDLEKRKVNQKIAQPENFGVPIGLKYEGGHLQNDAKAGIGYLGFVMWSDKFAKPAKRPSVSVEKCSVVISADKNIPKAEVRLATKSEKRENWKSTEDFCDQKQCIIPIQNLTQMISVTGESDIEVAVFAQNPVGWSSASKITRVSLAKSMEKPTIEMREGQMFATWKSCKGCRYELFWGIEGFKRHELTINNPNQTTFTTNVLNQAETYKFCIRSIPPPNNCNIGPSKFSCNQNPRSKPSPLPQNMQFGGSIGIKSNQDRSIVELGNKNCHWTSVEVCFEHRWLTGFKLFSEWEKCRPLVAMSSKLEQEDLKCERSRVEGVLTYVQEFGEVKNCLPKIYGLKLVTDSGHQYAFGVVTSYPLKTKPIGGNIAGLYYQLDRTAKSSTFDYLQFLVSNNETTPSLPIMTQSYITNGITSGSFLSGSFKHQVWRCSYKIYWKYPEDKGQEIKEYGFEISLNQGEWKKMKTSECGANKRWKDGECTLGFDSFFQNFTDEGITDVTWRGRARNEVGWGNFTQNQSFHQTQDGEGLKQMYKALYGQKPQSVENPILKLDDQLRINATWQESRKCYSDYQYSWSDNPIFISRNNSRDYECHELYSDLDLQVNKYNDLADEVSKTSNILLKDEQDFLIQKIYEIEDKMYETRVENSTQMFTDVSPGRLHKFCLKNYQNCGFQEEKCAELYIPYTTVYLIQVPTILIVSLAIFISIICRQKQKKPTGDTKPTTDQTHSTTKSTIYHTLNTIATYRILLNLLGPLSFLHLLYTISHSIQLFCLTCASTIALILSLQVVILLCKLQNENADSVATGAFRRRSIMQSVILVGEGVVCEVYHPGISGDCLHVFLVCIGVGFLCDLSIFYMIPGIQKHMRNVERRFKFEKKKESEMNKMIFWKLVQENDPEKFINNSAFERFTSNPSIENIRRRNTFAKSLATEFQINDTQQRFDTSFSVEDYDASLLRLRFDRKNPRTRQYKIALEADYHDLAPGFDDEENEVKEYFNVTHKCSKVWKFDEIEKVPLLNVIGTIDYRPYDESMTRIKQKVFSDSNEIKLFDSTKSTRPKFLKAGLLRVQSEAIALKETDELPASEIQSLETSKTLDTINFFLRPTILNEHDEVKVRREIKKYDQETNNLTIRARRIYSEKDHVQCFEGEENMSHWLKVFFKTFGGQPAKQIRASRKIEYCDLSRKNKANLLYFIAKTQYQQGFNSSAVMSLRKCLELDKDHYKASNLIGNILIQQDDNQNAAAYYLRVIKQYPQSINAHIGFMLTLKRDQNKIDCIFEMIQKKLELKKDDQETAVFLAILKFFEEDDTSAAFYLDKALFHFDQKGQDQFAPALFLVAEILRYKKTGKTAKAFYFKAFLQDPTQQIVLKGLARTCFDLKEYDESLMYYEAAKKLENNVEESQMDLFDDTHLRVNLAEQMIALDQRDKAYGLLDTLYQEDKEYKCVQKMLVKLSLAYMIKQRKKRGWKFSQNFITNVLKSICEDENTTPYSPNCILVLDNQRIVLKQVEKEDRKGIFYQNKLYMEKPNEGDLQKSDEEKQLYSIGLILLALVTSDHPNENVTQSTLPVISAYYDKNMEKQIKKLLSQRHRPSKEQLADKFLIEKQQTKELVESGNPELEETRNLENYKKDYKEGRQIGAGGYGFIYRVQRRKDMKIFVAKKQQSSEHYEAAKTELNLLQKLNFAECKYIVNLIESFVDENEIIMILEYCEQGDLLDKANSFFQKRERVPENFLIRNLFCILTGLNYAHSRDIIHADLKPQNILVDKCGVKITDFGIGCVKVKISQLGSCQVKACSPEYMAPEAFYSDPEYRSDIYSLGCLMYEMMTGEHIIQGDYYEIKEKIETYVPIKLPTSYSRELRFIVFLMLEKNIQKRPDSSQLLAMDLFRDCENRPLEYEEYERIFKDEISILPEKSNLSESPVFELSNVELLQNRMYVPSRKEIQNLFVSELNQLRMVEIAHANNSFAYLTIRFSTGKQEFTSPRHGAYHQTPVTRVEIPQAEITSLKLNLKKNKKGIIKPFQLILSDQEQELIRVGPQLDSVPFDKLTFLTIDFQIGERIVAARIDICANRTVACNMAFLIYDFI